MKTFDYFYTRTAMDTLNVENVGNCCIECANDDGLFYYLIINTSLGLTDIFTYGPIIPDINELPKNVSCTYKSIEYNEKKLEAIISDFINDGYKKVTQAREIQIVDALNSCQDIVSYLKNKWF